MGAQGLGSQTDHKDTYRTLLKLFPSAFARLAAAPNEAPPHPSGERNLIRSLTLLSIGMRQMSILTSTPKTARCQRSRLRRESRLLL